MALEQHTVRKSPQQPSNLASQILVLVLVLVQVIAGVKVIRGMIKSFRLKRRKHFPKTPLTCNLVNQADGHSCGENSGLLKVICDLNGKLN